MSPAMRFSVTDEDIDAAQSGGGEVAPAGFYDADVATNVYEDPGQDKNKRWHATYKIVGEETNYAPIHEYLVLTEASKWKVTQFLVATGQVTKAGNVDLNKAMPASVGKRVRLRVVNETYTPAQGDARTTAKPGGVWPPGKGTSTARAASENGLVKFQNMTEEELTEAEDDIRALAEPMGIDVDEFGTWVEVIAAMEHHGNGDAAESPADGSEGVQDPRWLEILGLDEDGLAEIADELETYNHGGLDPNSFDTWEGYREALNDALNNGGADTNQPEDYSTWSVEELRGELKQRGMDTKGGQATLVKRLSEADQGEGPFG